jgi:hypothetical protein
MKDLNLGLAKESPILAMYVNEAFLIPSPTAPLVVRYV